MGLLKETNKWLNEMFAVEKIPSDVNSEILFRFIKQQHSLRETK